MLKAGTTFKKQPKTLKEAPTISTKVVLKGDDIPAALGTFAEIGFDKIDLEPTLIQKHAIPSLINRRDLIGIAPTGSGKTLAYLLPIIKNQLKSLIIIPTRELEQQIKREIFKYDKECHVLNLENGNVEMLNKTLEEAKQYVVIATPQKLLNLISKELKLNVELLVLDECDKLLDLGFIDQIDEILACLPTGVQKALFSATIPSSIEMIAHSFMTNFVKITCGNVNTSQQVKQELIFVGQEEGKLIAVRNLLRQGIKPPILIFVQVNLLIRVLKGQKNYITNCNLIKSVLMSFILKGTRILETK